MRSRSLWLVYLIYFAGYFVHLAVAGTKTWSSMSGADWWWNLLLQSGWDAVLWPFYLPRLMGWW
jgi:hypothetical protein